MLHQKEIILNAHDTENFLTAIEIVRSIADKLDTNVKLAAQGLGGMVAAAGSGGAGGWEKFLEQFSCWWHECKGKGLR